MKSNNNKRGRCRVLLAFLLLPVAGALGEWSVPDELVDSIESLSEEQRAFITSGAAIAFIPETQLVQELPSRDAASLTGIAMNREGKTDAHYVSPLASEHAVDDYYGDQQQHLDATRREEEKAEKEKDGVSEGEEQE